MGCRTTRMEDGAYSLLGLFDINLSLLYSECEKKPFLRLKQEIAETPLDHRHDSMLATVDKDCYACRSRGIGPSSVGKSENLVSLTVSVTQSIPRIRCYLLFARSSLRKHEFKQSRRTRSLDWWLIKLHQSKTFGLKQNLKLLPSTV
jgi:hypothetical protein